MKIIYATLLGVLLIFPACNRSDRDRVRANGETVNTDQMRDERDRYVRSVEAKLDEFDQKFDGLNARASAMPKPAKQGFNDAVDSLREQRKDVARKLDDMKKVSIDSWMTLKGEVDTALINLERSYEQVSASHETVPAPATSPKTQRSY